MTHQLARRQFLAVGGSALALSALAACSSPTSGSTAPLTFWSSYPTSDPNDKSKKPKDFWIYQASARWTKKTGIPVKIEALPGDSTMFTKIRTAAIAGRGPDVASVWSGTYMLSIKDALEPMAPYFSDKEIADISGWAAVSDGFDPTKKDSILGVPKGSDGAMSLLCNVDMLSKAGVDPEKWPSSYEDWMGDLDQIKTSGVTPLTLGNQGIIFWLYDTWLAQAVHGSAGIKQLITGDRNFSDPDLQEVTKRWLALRDFTLPGAATTDDGQASQALFDKKAAMTMGGAGAIAPFQAQLGSAAGIAKLPDISSDAIHGGTVGGTGEAFIVSKTSKHKKDAADYIKHLLSKDEQQRFAASKDPGPLVGRTDMTDIYPDNPALNEMQEWSVAKSNTFWPDNTFPADLVNELGEQSQLVWNGSISGAEFLTRLDKKRDSLT